MTLDWHLVESIGLGLGLGIAAGFRVVVPFLVLSAAALLGHVPLADNLQWLGTQTALVGLVIALLVEILVYSLPWLDNLVDTVALPMAAIAGTLLMALAANQLDPFAQWSLAIVAGGGTAATVKGINGLTRFVSTATTGGATNILIAIAELLGAFLMALLALVAPLFVLGVALVLLTGLVWFVATTITRAKKTTPDPQ